MSRQRHTRFSIIHDIRGERDRQARKWSAGHDDEHDDGRLAIVAAALCVDGTTESAGDDPWGLVSKHRDNRRRQLVVAAALIVAEIERLDRQRPRSQEEFQSQADAEAEDAARLELLPEEVTAVATTPDGLAALASWHAVQETLAQGMGLSESAKRHETRRQELEVESARLQKEMQA